MGPLACRDERQVFLDSLKEKSAHGTLRGDYSLADRQYVVEQDMGRYTPQQRSLWRKLYERQARLLPGRACEEFIDSLAALDAQYHIPDLERTSMTLRDTTGWQLVAVPGLVPDRVFFEHLSERRFPVTVWLREASEFNYIVEPDLFHDFFGHVPLLFNPIVAEHMQQFGLGGLKALRLGGLEHLARLYWYTVEFGLIRTPAGLRAYGAGILSSGGEIIYSLDSKVPRRIPFDAKRIMRTRYKIDHYQSSYFVIESFNQLIEETAPDFSPLYDELKGVDALPAETLLDGEANLT